MDSSKKHKRKSIDFISFGSDRSKPTSKPFLSLSKFSIGKIFSHRGFFFQLFNILKHFKKVVYKQFFWGRGIYYKYSIIITIFAVLFPATVLASTLHKPEEVTKIENNVAVDTVFDTGNGKTIVSDIKTIDSRQEYIVQKNDTLDAIASKFGTTTDALVYTNSLSNQNLQIGQTLKILPIPGGILYKVKPGDTLQSIATKFDIARNGYSTQVLLDVNLLDSNDLKADQEILVPGAVIEKPKVTVAQRSTAAVIKIIPAPNSGFISPTNGVGNITTCFSSIHPALDIDSINGNPPLYASASGTVTWSGWGLSGGSGIAVRIDHGNGFVTEYLHFSRVTVSVGQVVAQGQQIGIMGATGRSTGTHIHWIIKYNGVEQNPMKYVNFSAYGRESDARTC